MIPVSLSGGIYQKSQAFLFLIPMACITGFSVWSNIHGIDLIFGDLPSGLLWLGYLFACIIDPVSILCFTLAAVSFRVYSVVSADPDKYKHHIDVEAVRSKSFWAGALFTGFMLALCGLSYILSMNGGKAGVSGYVKEKYAPKVGLDSLLSSTNKALFSDVSALKKDAESDIQALKNEISRAEKTLSHNWEKDAAKIKWGPNGTYNAFLSAQKTKTSAQNRLEAAQKSLAEKISAQEKRHDEIASAQKESFGKHQKDYLDKEAFSLGAFSWAVNIWTPLNILLGFFMYRLSSNEYNQVSAYFIGEEIKAKAASENIISNEMAKYGTVKQAPVKVESTDGQTCNIKPKKNGRQRLKDRVGAKVNRVFGNKQEPQPIGFKAQQSGKQTEPKQERRQAPPIVENKANFKPTNDTETLLGALGQNNVAKPDKWLQKPANLEAMLDKELQAAFSTKKQIAEKYNVHPSTVDGLRSKQNLIFKTMGEERARKALEEIKKGLNR